MRRLPVVRRDPGGSGARRRRARRRHEQQGRPDARAPRADLDRAVRPAPQGLHHRRGPADHPGLGRPPPDPRGAARPRRVHLLHHRPDPDPAGRPVPCPALRVPPPDDPPDRGQAGDDPRRRRTGAPMPEAIRLVARQAAGGMRDAESMLDQLLASSAERLSIEAVRDLLGLVDAEVIDAVPRRARRGRRARRDRHPRRPRGSRPGPRGVPRPAGRRAARVARRRAAGWPAAGLHAVRGRASTDGRAPDRRDRPEPARASAASASSSSSPCRQRVRRALDRPPRSRARRPPPAWCIGRAEPWPTSDRLPPCPSAPDRPGAAPSRRPSPATRAAGSPGVHPGCRDRRGRRGSRRIAPDSATPPAEAAIPPRHPPHRPLPSRVPTREGSGSSTGPGRRSSPS